MSTVTIYNLIGQTAGSRKRYMEQAYANHKRALLALVEEVVEEVVPAVVEEVVEEVVPAVVEEVVPAVVEEVVPAVVEVLIV